MRLSLGSSKPELAVYHGTHTPCALHITDEAVAAFATVLRIVFQGPRTVLLVLSGELVCVRDRELQSARLARSVQNETLALHVVRIQRAWLAVYRRRARAAACIQRQFRVANYDPSYRLCRCRLTKEFAVLSTVT